jgi:GT2 family glycosyltransferase
MPQPLLFVIVLNNNRIKDVLACLDSLFQSDYKNLKVLLVDIDSEEKTRKMISQRFLDVQIIPLTTNLGYAGNNNIGIQAALSQGAEWILILNDDTILDPLCLSHLVDAGESNSKIGIVGPMVFHFDEPNVIQSAGGMLGLYWQSIHLGKDEIDQGQFQSMREVDWISGCAILVRKAVIDKIGMLDVDYFLYWEETEWCIRAAKAGWKILQVPHAKLWHKGVQREYQPQPYVTYYSTRNRLFTLEKHKAPIFIRMLALANVLRTLFSWSVKPRWRFKRDHRNAMWRGLIDFLYRRMGPMTL